MSGMLVSAEVRLIDKLTSPSKKMERSSEKLGRRLSSNQRSVIKHASSYHQMADQLDKATRGTRKFTLEQRKLGKEIERINKLQRKSAKIGMIGAGAGAAGYGVMRMLSNPMDVMRGVERSRGELQSLDMSKAGVDAVVKEGRAMSKAFAGINPAAFTAAAYDIKSGISSLSDESVGKMTALAAMTAKATKSDTAGMTSLFATSYGVFKENLYSEVGDIEFGNILSAALSGSVKQFKTDGAKMQMAIEAMGSGLAAAGTPLEEQFTALGMLQQKMNASVAGTAMKALAAKSATAQQRFEKMGIAIETLDANGNMRSLPDLLDQAQAAFGDKYTTATGAMLLEAFGSEEAVKVFEALWGQSKAFRSNMDSINLATQEGAEYTRQMARNMDNNMDARLKKMQQRWDDMKLSIGYAMLPLLERVIPVFESIGEGISNFIGEHPRLTSALVGMTGLVAGIAIVTAPVITAIAGLIYVIGALGKRAKMAQLEASLGGGSFGKRGRKGGRLSGLKGKGGMLAAGVAALSIGSTLLGDGSAAEKAAGVTQDVGGLGGALAGGAAGAALGSIVPVIGTTIGGLIGASLGYFAGDWVGEKAGSAFLPDQKPLVAAKASPVVTDNSRTTIHVSQQPGEDGEALARRITDIQERNRASDQRSRLYD